MTLFQIAEESILLNAATKIIKKDAFSKIVSADAIVEKAQNASKDIINSALEEKKQIEEDAYKNGYSKGVDQVMQLLKNNDETMKQIRHEMQEMVIPLALKAAEKVVSAEITLRSDAIVDIVDNTIKKVLSHKKVKIFVSGEDIDIISSKKSHFLTQFEHIDSFIIDERKDLTKGSVIIETEQGIINATFETLLSSLRSIFMAFES